MREYPDMKHYKDILPLIESSGYKLIHYFELPSESWWTDYYAPMEKKVKEIRETRKLDKEGKAVIDSLSQEMEMHRRYHEYYGYGFYIMKKE